ncbi:MAG: ChaN family lipoprotein [Rickettsiales bacterium]|nr:ChaN family lipoprotein [Rickettsiales bacterium]
MSQVFNTVSDQLKTNEGVFLGETHTNSLVPDFLITHMKELKAQGVTTIYMEMDHALLAAKSLGKECKSSYMGDDSVVPEEVRKANANPDSKWNRENDYGDVIRAARAAGIRVIGTNYDHKTNSVYAATVTVDDKGELIPTELGIKKSNDAEAMDKRDAFATEVVKATRDGGKYVIYGGQVHSRAKGAFAQLPSEGLPERLGIPSIDFMTENHWAQLTDRHIHQTGYTAMDRGTRIISGQIDRWSRSGTDVHTGIPGHQTFAAVDYDGKGRYEHRDQALTDLPDKKGLTTMDPRASEVGRAMKAAGVCAAPPDGKMVRDVKEISTSIVPMVMAQYPESFEVK